MDKFKALAHLVIQASSDPEKLGAVRLNKILWFADTAAYRITRNSISGAKYVRRKNGPVPAQILVSIRELKNEGKISVEEPKYPHKPRLFKSLQPANDSLFSQWEQDFVKDLTELICSNYSAYEISELSHDDVWEAASDGEEIPLTATLIKESGDFPATIRQWASRVVTLHSKKGTSDGRLAN